MSIESRSSQYGTVFGHWQMKERLGSGSGGKTAVFKLCRTDDPSWKSALKVINLIEREGDRDSLTDNDRKEYEQAKSECKDSARREVDLMNQLHGNTNIVDYSDHTFADWSDENGFGCDMLIRMELLEDLRGKLRKGTRYSEKEVLKIGRDICTALVLCHRKGIIHRDIKPENIFINADGDFKLGDFGVSRILSSAPAAFANTGIGTPAYAAPEQFSGPYDKRVDIYSLGLVLYELSNGNRLPFASSSYVRPEDTARRQSSESLPVPRNASEDLAKVILKACASKKEDRYQTAEELLAALNSLSGASVVPPTDISEKSNTTQETDTIYGSNTTQKADTVRSDNTTQETDTVHSDNSTQKATADDIKTISGKITVVTTEPNVTSDDKKDDELKKRWETLKRRITVLSLAVIVCVASVLCLNLLFSNQKEPSDDSSQDTELLDTESTAEPTVEPTTELLPLTMSEFTGNIADLSALTFSDASATSELNSETYGKFPASNAIDGDTLSSWQEGAAGYGIGESITLSFQEETEVSAISLYLGNMESKYAYYANSRPKELQFTFSDGTACTYRFNDQRHGYHLALSHSVKTEYIQITILDAYEAKWKDTVISEVIAYGASR